MSDEPKRIVLKVDFSAPAVKSERIPALPASYIAAYDLIRLYLNSFPGQKLPSLPYIPPYVPPMPYVPTCITHAVPNIAPSREFHLAQLLLAAKTPAATVPAEPAPLPRKMRKRAVAGYKSEVARATGRRISNTEIWMAARYTDQSVFYRWLRGETDSQTIDRVLHEKPHLHKSQ